MTEQSDQPQRLVLSTRLLLTAAAWASLCYAMVFTIPPNMILFCAVRFLACLLVIACFLLPVCLELEKREFWIATSVSAFGLLLFSHADGYSNPLAGYLAELLYHRFGFEKGLWPERYGYGFETQDNTIGRWNAVYSVVELNLVILCSLLAGWFWEKFGNRTPACVMGIWAFAWSLGFGVLWKHSNDVFFSQIATQVSVLTFIALMLPSVKFFDFSKQPFWPVFSVTGFLICAQLVPFESESYATPLAVAIASQFYYRPVDLVATLLLLAIPIGSLVVASAISAIVAGRERRTTRDTVQVD